MSIFYKENAFRILLVSANANRSEILDAYQSLRARARVGGMQPPLDPLLFLNSIERNELTLRDALNRIDNPLTRVRERLFWLVDISSGRTSWTNLMGNGKPDSASKVESVTDIPSRINLAILKHSTCIATDPTAKNPSIWENALSEWNTLINDESFWEWTQTVEQKSGFEPRANSAEIENLRSEAWYLVLGYTRQQIHLAFETKKYDDLKRHQTLTHFITSQSSVARRILSEILNPIEDLLEEKQKLILADLKITLSNQDLIVAEKKNACDQSYESYLSTLVPLVEEVVQIAGVDTDESRRAREKVASCLREIAVTGYNNALRDYEMSEKLLKDSEAMAFETLYADRLNEDLKVVSENAAQVRYQEKLAPIQTMIDLILATIPKLVEDSSNAITVRECTIKAFTQFKNEIVPKVGDILVSEGIGSDLSIECKRICAEFLRTVAVTHHKTEGSLAQTLSILQEAKKLAQNTNALVTVEEDIATVSKLLHDEKLYKELKTIKSAPYMGTINGIGTTLYGYSDFDSTTNSYLTTLYFVFVFIPVFPIARYRVVNKGERMYSFLGKVKFRTLEKIHLGIFVFLVGLVMLSPLWQSNNRGVAVNSNSPSSSQSYSRLQPTITSAALFEGKDIDLFSTQSVNTLSPWQANFTCRTQVENVVSPTTVEVIWVRVLPDRLDSSIVSKRVTVRESTPVDFTFTPGERPMKQGPYQFRILIDGIVAQTLEFNVTQNSAKSNRNIPRSFVPDPTSSGKDESLVKINGYRERLHTMESRLGEIRTEIDSYKEQIDTYGNTIKRIERDNNNGYDVDRDEYNTALSNHNYYVELHNTALSKYKSLYSEYEDLLQVANEAIKKYNGE